MTSAQPAVTAVVVATYDQVARARATVRSALEHGSVACLVVDVDGTYRPTAEERVEPLARIAARLGVETELLTAAATLQPHELSFYAGVVGAGYLASEKGVDEPFVMLGAGVHVLGDVSHLAVGVEHAVVVPATDAVGARRRAVAGSGLLQRDSESGLMSVLGGGQLALLSPDLYVLRRAAGIDVLRGLAADWRTAPAALDAFAVLVGASLATRAELLVTAWRGIGSTSLDATGRPCVDGKPIVALNLSALDTRRPWSLDPDARAAPRVMLSEHPVLARLADAQAEVRRSDDPDKIAVRPGRAALDAILRSEARRAMVVSGDLPDVLGLGLGDDLEAWALHLVPDDSPLAVARYLGATHLARPDLQQAFRRVPGPDAKPLARWALGAGTHEAGHDAQLLVRAAKTTIAAHSRNKSATGPRPDGVNLVGYLAGELGIGESARQVDAALRAARVATSTFDVQKGLESRRRATYRTSEPIVRSTTIVCLNGADTVAMAPQLTHLLRDSRVIGMWYWELEDFPAVHRAGFKVVDEVWVATDYMHEAVARHAPEHVPIRTVMPPLPQASEDVGPLPAHFGIPTDRPWFLFTFDFQSFALRKNPYGLVDAFTEAFADRPSHERPVLVIKTINAERHPGDAERLRLQIAGRNDVIFLDAYLDHHQRHVLVAHCTAYVSLHRAEGLGLTVAEAMAWGRPVITTAYGGVMQFCTPENSLLVDWRRGYVERTTGPYVEGLPWAEPDLAHAAALMRRVVDDPGAASALGRQAARDIRELHNPAVAGERMRALLEEGEAQWQGERAERIRRRRDEAPDRPSPSATVRPTARPARPGGARRWIPGQIRSILGGRRGE